MPDCESPVDRGYPYLHDLEKMSDAMFCAGLELATDPMSEDLMRALCLEAARRLHCRTRRKGMKCLALCVLLSLAACYVGVGGPLNLGLGWLWFWVWIVALPIMVNWLIG
jgi:hypothetical protein